MGCFLFGSVFFNVSYITASVEISKGIIPEQYIVVLKDDSVRTVSEVADKMAAFHGIKVKHVYRHAIKGFSARIPDHKLEDLKRDPYVRLVDADRFVFAMSEESGKHKSRKKENAPPLQVLPTGVDRVDAELNMISHPVDADIAILDTGIDLDHPDLNVVENVAFITSEREGDDDNGHGSHVAGIAAAKANEIGVIGVAPGARLWAVKVLDRNGTGSWSSVIAGIDWITERADQIEVANMSFCGNGSDTESSLRIAIENSTAAGIIYVVSAGNDSKDARDCVPAAYDSVITVSAIADSDGKRWGRYV